MLLCVNCVCVCVRACVRVFACVCVLKVLCVAGDGVLILFQANGLYK